MLCILLAISTLLTSWQFRQEPSAQMPNVDTVWREVTIPHDWAISGPFDRENDLQKVIVVQNGENEATWKTGRSGGLPWMGKAHYRTRVKVNKDKFYTLVFDGAMSHADVYVNGEEMVYWPYGYNTFDCYILPHLITSDSVDIDVFLENKPQQSRWYPGAGLYRNVHLVESNPIHIPTFGVLIRTPKVSKDFAQITFAAELQNGVEELTSERVKELMNEGFSVHTDILFDGKVVATIDGQEGATDIRSPLLWSPETPNIYVARTRVYKNKEIIDEVNTPFGIRSVSYTPEHGFQLNGETRKFKGVCLHHDLGPLGVAIHKDALRHQLTMLKEMGCDAVRTSHNMPAPELVELCDEMGFMMMVEAFDEWDIAKCDNGYHLYFDEWAEKDMINMIRHFRNNPSVIMWGIGNEVPTQCAEEGYKVAAFLQDICHREDPTRLVTAGMDRADCVVRNGFAQLLDVVGFNYRTYRYTEAYDILPQKLLLGSETASTVSSRGVYKLPAEPKSGAVYPDNQSSAFDVESCWWSNVPDIDFAMMDDYPWTIGQFVWTGFDYLGEPTPYDVDAWPSHSSYFGIFDLASLPKDRYWLYRSQWRKDVPTLHLLPHWTWPGRKGERIPVFCYTSYPMAELFVNGVSYGVKRFETGKTANSGVNDAANTIETMPRYRLMWPDVEYVPGRIEVVAYDESGREQAREAICTAGEPARIELSADRDVLDADGLDLAYVTVRIVDKDGNLCPVADNRVRFEVSGAGVFRACANGDAACLEPFQHPEMPAFSGQLTAIVQAADKPGTVRLTALSDGLESAVISLRVK